VIAVQPARRSAAGSAEARRVAEASRCASDAANAPLQVGVAGLRGAALRFTLLLRCGAAARRVRRQSWRWP
jgi:hypothetical protein